MKGEERKLGRDREEVRKREREEGEERKLGGDSEEEGQGRRGRKEVRWG